MFLLPLIVVIVILEKAVQLANRVFAPVAPLLGERPILGASAATIGSVAALLLLCLVAVPRRRFRPRARLYVVLGIAFVLFYVVQITLGRKKFTRYALPALQFVVLLAAVGWTYVLRRVLPGRCWLRKMALLTLIVIQCAVSVPRHPYYGTHYNYALGGPKVILENEIVPGQEKGEGMEIAADYLNRLPLSKLLVVGAEPFCAFYYYFDGKTVPLTDDRVDYILMSRSSLLRRV